MTDLLRFPEEILTKFCIDLLMAVTVSEADAREISAAIIFADKRGIASHGCSMLPGYIHHLRSNYLNPRPKMRMLADGLAYAIVDGDGGLGAITAAKCARIAIEKATKSGIGFVTARNSSHFGAGSYYALMMSNAAMIGEVISNAPPVMAPTGSRERALGNNPYAVAAPTKNLPYLVLDIATSVVAGRKVMAAAEAGEKLPSGWLMDSMGNPSTNPHDFSLGGTLVPLGGYKGYGLALAFEVLSGVLSGAGIASEIQKQEQNSGGVGHIFRAINITAFMPLDVFYHRMDLLIGQMKNAEKAPGVREILIPGEAAYKHEVESNLLGVPLTKKTFGALTRLASTLGVELLKIENLSL